MSEYYTVTQFAEITGKDPGNIRRLLAYGRLAGEKLGKQWVIPKDAVILKDGSTEKMHDEMTDVVVDYGLDQAVTLSVMQIEYDQYMVWNKTLPFYKNIDKEGLFFGKQDKSFIKIPI